MKTSLRALALVGVTCLVLGLALGFAFGKHRGRGWGGPGGPRPPAGGFHNVESTVRWLDKELKLTADQKAAVAAAVTRGKETFRAVYQDTGPQLEACRKVMQDEIKAVLAPEQVARYDELLKEREERFGRFRGGPPVDGEPAPAPVPPGR